MVVSINIGPNGRFSMDLSPYQCQQLPLGITGCKCTGTEGHYTWFIEAKKQFGFIEEMEVSKCD